MDQNFNIFNNGSITRFATTYLQSSAIDLSITNSPVFTPSHWEVLNEPWGSDHFPIRIEIIAHFFNRLRFHASTRIYNKKTDWKKVKRCLLMSIQSCEQLILDNSIDTQSKYNTFMAIIENAIRSNTPFRLSQAYKSTHQFNSNPYLRRIVSVKN